MNDETESSQKEEEQRPGFGYRGHFEAKTSKNRLPLVMALALVLAAALLAALLLPKFLSGGDAPAETGASGTEAVQTTGTGGESSTGAPVTTEPVTTAAVTTEAATTEAVTTAPVTTEAAATEAPTTEPPATEAPAQQGGVLPTEPVPQPSPTDVTVGPGDVTTKGYTSGTVYVTEGCGYGGYWFGEKNSGRYCDAVNSVAKAVEGKANVYCIVCPLSGDVKLSTEVRRDAGFGDQKEAIEWMYSHMDPLVKTVNVYGALKSHNDEYIYFKTDHHWTTLGAWYAYREFCAIKGMGYHSLDSFQTYSYDDYLGSFYNYSKKDKSIGANNDTVVAYIPAGTNEMTTYMPSNGGYAKYSWPIVKDVSNYSRGNYYLGFVGGDQPHNYAHNEAIQDGSSVLIVKDSYGNAFIPFLIDHYEHIYWIDYREYPKWCAWAGISDTSISNFVERNNIQDVILCNNISSTGSGTLLGYMEPIFK